jgi:hypothetical protein
LGNLGNAFEEFFVVVGRHQGFSGADGTYVVKNNFGLAHFRGQVDDVVEDLLLPTGGYIDVGA